MPHKRSKTANHVKSLREKVFLTLWEDRKYQRLHAFKDAALKQWNRADAWKNSPSARPGEVEFYSRRVARATARLQRYEDAALKKVGLTP
jgi:hypothetical protein